MEKPIIAFIYDFDHTLSVDDMQNFSFIPSLGLTKNEFWGATNELSSSENMEKILSYMYMMVKKAKTEGISLTRKYLKEQGKNIKFFEGVTTWFKRINEYAKTKHLNVEHYILSSGTGEILEGCSIAKEFKRIYGCEFLYDENDEACWPKMAINYTAKTQFLFRISKGVLDLNDDKTLNKRTGRKRVPFTNMVYFGDGLTDVPCMALVTEKGGKAIAIYKKEQKNKVQQLYEDGRVNFVCKADYKSGSQLETVAKLIIDQIGINERLQKKESQLSKF